MRSDAFMLFTTAPSCPAEAPAAAGSGSRRPQEAAATIVYAGSLRNELSDRLRGVAARGGGDAGAAVSYVLDALNRVRACRVCECLFACYCLYECLCV